MSQYRPGPLLALFALSLAPTALAQHETPRAEAAGPAPDPGPVVNSTRRFDDIVPEAPDDAPPPGPLALPPPPPPPPGALQYPVVQDDPGYGRAAWGSAPPLDLGPRAPRERERQWYGWQTLTLDGAALGTLLLAAAADSSELVVVSGLTYAVGPALVHTGHGRPGAALGSIALRLGGPAIGGYLGSAPSGSDLGTAVLGVLLGMAGAIALDSAVLARKDAPVAGSRAAHGVRWVPRAHVERTSATLGLDGVF
ncbi:MAG: hypothetical protein KF718_20055 [Polyangiaceae bacterium]|nr:hypothetical protein [Polyangiaceae bacterium]